MAALLALVAVPGLVPPAASDAPWTLPPVRLGDRVEYVEAGGERIVWQVARVATTLDRDGVPHDVVVLYERRDDAIVIPGTEREALQRVLHLDARTLDVVRVDHLRLSDDALATSYQATSAFGPASRHGLLGLSHPLLAHRAHGLAPGNVVSLARCASPTLEVSEERRATGAAATLDGAPAVEVVARRDHAYALPDGARVAGTTSEVVWVSASEPYPARIVTSETTPGGATRTRTWTLAAFTAGAHPLDLPLGGPQTCPSPVPPAPAPGQAGASRVPGEGHPGLFRYPLEDAIRSVESDVTLAPFTLWRQLHPDAFLAGLVYWQDSPQRSADYVGDQWLLSYVSGRDVATVSTHRAATGAPPANSVYSIEAGLLETAVRSDDLPAAPRSFAEAAARWWEIADEDTRAAGINGAQWGVSGVYFNGCDAWGACEDLPLARHDLFLSTIEIGHSTGTSPNGATGARADWLYMDTVTGALQLYTSVSFDSVVDGPSSSAARAPILAPPAATSGRDPVLVLVAGSLVLLLLLALLAPLYSRLRKARLLDHATRGRIRDAIAGSPGTSPPALMDALGVPWSTLVYHLGVLERNGVVVGVIDGRNKRLFLAGAQGSAELATAAVLAQERTRDVWERVTRNPGVSQTDLARATGVSLQGVKWHLERLEGVGLLRRERVGRVVRCFPR